MRTLTASLAFVLATAATAFAAQPVTPSKWVGGNGAGAPVMFNLSKKGKVKKAGVAYTCKGANGIGFAQKRRPKGHVKPNGTLSIRYRIKDSDVGRIRVRWHVTFPTSTTAKGQVTFKSRKCKAQDVNFTAEAAQG
jgi:hypothetical protein